MKNETGKSNLSETFEDQDASYEAFSKELKSHAGDDFQEAINLAKESFETDLETEKSDSTKNLQEISARELFFMARNMENKTLPLEEARQAVKTGLEAQIENKEVNSFFKSADLMLKVRDASKEDRRKLFYQHLKNLLVEWNQKKLTENEFFDEIVRLSSLAYESGVKEEAFRALEAVKTSLNSEMYFRAYSYLAQIVNNSGEAVDRMKTVVESSDTSEKVKGHEYLLNLNRDVEGIIDSLEKLKSLDEKIFAKNVGAAVWNLLERSKKVTFTAEQSKKLFRLVQEAEIKIEEIAKAGPIRERNGYIEEPMLRLSLVTAYALLGKMDEAIATFDRMKARATRAQEIVGKEFEGSGSKKSGISLEFEASQMEGKYLVRRAKHEIAKAFAEQGKIEEATEWTGEVDQNDRQAYHDHIAVVLKKAMFVKITGGDPMPILKPFLLPQVKELYSSELKEMANLGLLSKEVLKQQIELFADTIEVNLDTRDWGYDFIEILEIAREQKISVPHAYELARHLAETPELMSESGRVTYLARLAALESGG